MTIKFERIFYVYALFRPTGIICYIGKGSGNRINRHERFAKRDAHRNPHLLNIIKQAGGTVPKIVIKDGLTEAEAFGLEIVFIRAIGREINGGPLVNMTNGGEGPSGIIFDEASLKLISEKSIAYWSSPEARLRHGLIQTESWKNPTRKENHAKALEQMWKDPEVRERHKNSLYAYWANNPEAKLIKAEKQKTLWTDERRKRNSAQTTERWQSLTDEQRIEHAAKSSTNFTTTWETDRAKMLDGINRAWDNEDRRNDTADRARAQWTDPDIRARMIRKMSEAQHRRWARARGEIV